MHKPSKDDFLIKITAGCEARKWKEILSTARSCTCVSSRMDDDGNAEVKCICFLLITLFKTLKTTTMKAFRLSGAYRIKQSTQMFEDTNYQLHQISVILIINNYDS